MATFDHTVTPQSLNVQASVPKTGSDATAKLRQRLQQWCGVEIGADKAYLLTNRLRPLLQEVGVSDYDELLKIAESASGVRVRDRIVDVLTTHETLFFRDRSPFEAIRNHLIPEIRNASATRRPTLRVWSAACSTGQEPYSIAMSLVESLPDLKEWHILIIATDVSSGTIATAKQGRYQDHEVSRGTSPQQRERFFVREGELWAVRSEIRAMVQFQVGDLTSAVQPSGPFDLIFCRNVLIYFPRDVATQVLERMVNRLSSDGRLFLGSSEIPHESNDLVQTERMGMATCFRRRVK
ncbi:MAG: protein-glutamate O-methyltransferase CheR [Planctomycetota bacterium]